MFNTLWKKSWRDVLQNKGRSFGVILSIAISTFLIGIILVSYSILSREMNVSFLKAKPHALSFRIDSFNENLLTKIKGHPAVKEADARRVITGRIQRKNGDWIPLLLFVLRDYDDVVLDVVKPEIGSWPPGKGEILLERQALSVLRGTIGDEVSLKTQNGIAGKLKLSGLVYDVVLPQAAMENVVYGYVSAETLNSIGGETFFNELNITLSENWLDMRAIRLKAGKLKTWLTENGYDVRNLTIPIPGKHPHYDLLSGNFLIQQIFAILLCFFSGILVFNLTSATLSGQLKQIGVMKTLGARGSQIVMIYLGGAIFFGLIGLLLSLPFAPIVGRLYADKMAVMMNYDIENDSAEIWVYLVTIGLGLCIPLIAASIPILRASQISIREAFVDYGLGQTNFGLSAIDRLLGRVPFLSRPMLIALRNTFRKKGRLILTLCVLSMGATLYMSALNLETTVKTFVSDVQQTKAWGLRVNFKRAYDIQKIRQRLHEISGVKKVEPFFQITSAVIDEGGEAILFLPLICIDPASEMLKFPFLEGRRLNSGKNSIVINQYLANRLPHLKIGDELKLRINDVTRTYRVSGITKTLGEQRGFINFQEAASFAGQENLANGFYINGVSRERSDLSQLRQKVYKKIKENNLELEGLVTSWEGLESLESHFIFIYALILMLTLIAISIGVNGIILSMRANIVERTREIGVLKSIGASKFLLFRIIVGEGLVIGTLSWLLAIVATFPISYLFAYGFGVVLIQYPLPLAMAPYGFVICLPLMLIVSAFSCYFPARSTAKLSVREALLYE